MQEKKLPLHVAIIENDDDTARRLILDEANVDELSHDGWAPLHLCAQTNNLNVAKWLINAGARINVKNHKGVTPLHSCSWNNTFEIAKLLLQHGANVNVKDSQQWTPLMLAAWSNHDNLIDLYVSYGASINARNSNGSSALHLAAYNDSPLVISSLLSHKANVNIQNNDQMAPLDIAIKRKHKDCQEILRGAKSRTKATSSTVTTPVHISETTYTSQKKRAASTSTPTRKKPKASTGKTTKKTASPKNEPPVIKGSPSNSKKREAIIHKKPTIALPETEQVKPKDKTGLEQVYDRDIFFLHDKPDIDMPFLTELTKEQARFSSDGQHEPSIFPEQLINTTLAGDKVRRKSEVIIANLLYSLDLSYIYERKLCGTVAVGINYPAFTVFCPDDSIIIWEHVSALETLEKKQQFNLLKRWYKQNGFIEGKNFFVSMDTPQGGIDSQKIWDVVENINTHVESIREALDAESVES